LAESVYSRPLNLTSLAVTCIIFDMNFFWKMPNGLKGKYKAELDAYRKYLQAGDLQHAWRQLERAHILGQPWAVEHTHVHWIMLKFGIKIKSNKEIIGQISRLLIGGVKSFVGKVPIGNTGGANVPPLKRMEIPKDLMEMMRHYVKF
jgi:hypothetical protein